MIVTTDPDEFMDLTFALAYMPLPPGKRVAVATWAAAGACWCRTRSPVAAWSWPTLSPEVIEGLNELLPPFWSHSNPIDLVATITPGVPEAVVETLVASDDGGRRHRHGRHRLDEREPQGHRGDRAAEALRGGGGRAGTDGERTASPRRPSRS